MCEEDFKFASQFDSAPADADEAIRNYEMVLDSIGQLSGDFIAPRAESVDREGSTLNADGSVSYAKGIAESMDKLAKAEVMGFTLPHRFGGINFPNLVYSMATEIVSRRRLAYEYIRVTGYRGDNRCLRVRGNKTKIPA